MKRVSESRCGAEESFKVIPFWEQLQENFRDWTAALAKSTQLAGAVADSWENPECIRAFLQFQRRLQNRAR